MPKQNLHLQLPRIRWFQKLINFTKILAKKASLQLLHPRKGPSPKILKTFMAVSMLKQMK